MATDRARRTFDATREYRAVVWQQGRVTVEADGNEAEEIRADQARRNLVDVIGPAGTPDDGFRVTVPAPSGRPFDFVVGPGTMYVGGVRVQLDQPSGWQAQAARDWLDMPAPTTDARQDELVVLWLQEAEVSAVEDSSLREPALGGPDTAARLRLLQRIQRFPVGGGDCSARLADAAAAWQEAGLHFDRPTRRLRSTARLQVTFSPESGPTSVCEPAAQAGYLGDENQLVRVQLAANPETLAVDRLVWGYDNGSFLYRVQPSSAAVLALGSIPVDAQHSPRAGQAVEVLRATAKLDGGEYVAAPYGFVTTLASKWDPSTGTVELKDPLPQAYLDAAETTQLFLRVWEEVLRLNDGEVNGRADRAIPLEPTGLRVTLTGGPFVAGDHWLIGARPGVPDAVYPRRLMETPQPPDGPQRWATPLAALHWTSEKEAAISDCRSAFDDLVELSKVRAAGCCTIKVTPADLRTQTLQGIIDRQVVGTARGVVVCLAAGRYLLPEPLRLEKRHSGLTLEGCAGQVVIAAAPDAVSTFADGLVVLHEPVDLTLRGLHFDAPMVPFDLGKLQIGGQTRDRLKTEVPGRMLVSVGIHAWAPKGLRITDCGFSFARSSAGQVTAAGLRLLGGCQGVQVEGTRFVSPTRGAGSSEGDRPDSYLGVFGGSALSLEPESLPGPTGTMRAQAVSGPIDDFTVRGCRFEGGATSLWLAGPLGELQIEDNVVRGAVSGFILVNGAGRVTAATLADSDSTPELPDAEANTNWLAFAAAQNSLRRNRNFVLAEIVHRTATPLSEMGDKQTALRFRPGQIDKSEREAWERIKHPILEGSDRGPPVRPAAPVGAERLPDIFDDLADTLARVDRVLARAQAPQLRLQATGNDIRTVQRESGGAFWLLNDVGATTGESVFNGNRLRVRAPSLAALRLSPVSRCGVTGNVVINEAPITQTLPGSVVIKEARTGVERFSTVAVTGNIFVGAALLPERIGVPPPFDTWGPFNSFALP